MRQNISNLPVGAKVKDPLTKYREEPIVWIIADKNHEGYPANTVTLISEKILTLKAFDASEPSNTDANRQKYGNNNYRLSNILQWLNSSSYSWYKAQHDTDAPPISQNVYRNPYDNEPGFMNGFSGVFKDAILATSVKTNTAGAGISELAESKFFLASRTEVGLGNETSVPEGKKLALFGDTDTSRRAYPTSLAVSKDSYTDSGISVNDSWNRWLRTPHTTNLNGVRGVAASGSLDQYDAHRGTHGVRPLCNLQSEILVSSVPGSDGAYLISQYFAPKLICNSEKELGQIEDTFRLAYNVSSNYKDTLNVKELVDGKEKNSFQAKSGSNLTVTFKHEYRYEIPNGKHTLKIEVTDGEGGEAQKEFTFTKNETKISFQLKEPMQADDMATKAIITLEGKIPENAIWKVEACNNGYDNTPARQDVTQQVKYNQKIFFANKEKTAEKRGVNIRVSVDRNGSSEECYISAIGGNFE